VKNVNSMFTKRNALIIVASGSALCLTVATLFLFLPLVRENRKKSIGLAALTKELAYGYHYVAMVQRSGAAKKLIPQADVSWAIDAITKEARKHRLIVKTASQKDVVDTGNFYCLLPLEIELEGGYRDIGLFFHALEVIPGVFVNVDTFTLRYDEAIAPRLSLRLILQLYVSKG